MKTAPSHPAHRATTANVRAAYPFVAEGGIGSRGALIGRDLYGGSFVYDPWALYGRELTSPNMLVASQLGAGKSSLVKSYVYRQAGVFGRRACYVDVKGEAGPLARALGVEPVRLRPHGGVRLNPLDPNAIRGDDRGGRDRQLALLAAMAAAALRRDLAPEEGTALAVAYDAVVRRAADGGGEPTLPLAVHSLLHPDERDARRVATNAKGLARASRDLALRLRDLCDGHLRGMFDGPTTAALDLDAPLVVLDVSETDEAALPIAMLCAAAWLQASWARDDRVLRIVVLDEAWRLLHEVAIARWLRASWKLARATGTQMVAVLHRWSDLTAAGDSGSEAVALAQGLLSDSETVVVYRQAPGEIDKTRELLGLSSTEAEVVPELPRGVALWKVGRRSFLVEHRLSPRERLLVDTDARMTTSETAA